MMSIQYYFCLVVVLHSQKVQDIALEKKCFKVSSSEMTRDFIHIS